MTQATYLRTADVPLDELTPYPGNARRGDTAAILTSLRRNAQYRAVVVRELPDGTLVVLAGNNTLAAMREHGAGNCGVTFKRGLRKVPCGVCRNKARYVPRLRAEIVRCDEDTARRANLADNRTAELGEWDDDALAELLGLLDADLDGTAYTAEDYTDLLTVTADVPEEPADKPPPAAGLPSLHPFSDTTAPAPVAAAAPAAPPPAAAAALENPAAAEQEPPAAAPPPPFSPGVHTGPDAYAGPGARKSAGEGVQLPPRVTTVPLQWVFTVDQRDVVHVAISAAQAEGHKSAAAALTAICEHYLSTAGEPAEEQELTG